MENAKIIGPTFVTVMIKGVTYTINSDHANYKLIKDALKKNDYKTAEKYINVAKAIENYVSGKVTVVNGKVMYGKDEVKGPVVDRIIQMLREGFDANPMVNFLTNLMKNPSKRAVDELYLFLEASNLPITEDGCFLAYKKVNSDYKDFYTGKMDNSVGTIVQMERNAVDDDKDRTCSTGLHFCSLGYLPHYHGGSGKVMIVKINPADVVSIPSDYSNQKGRTAKYEVIGEHTDEKKNAFTAPVYTNAGTPVSVKKASTGPSTGNPGLAGYNSGRSDAAAGRPYAPGNNGFSGSAADKFADAYRKGWNSISSSAQVPGTCFEDDDDAVTLHSDNYDWYEAGFETGKLDADNGSVYNGGGYPDDCIDDDEQNDYDDGYSDGWYESKANRKSKKK